MRRALTSLAAVAAGVTISGPGFANVTPGERTFIDSTVAVPTSVMNLLGKIYPESSVMATALLTMPYEPVLTITKSTKVAVTFVWEGAVQRHALGYLTYDVIAGYPRIIDRQLIFPNASFADAKKGWGGGKLATGDTVTLRDINGNKRVFSPGTNIGFFLVTNGWSGSAVYGWNANSSAIPAATPAGNARLSAGAYTTLDELNPEGAAGRPDLARHATAVRMKGMPGFLGGADYLVIGMEERRRTVSTGDDFNDVLFIANGTTAGSTSSNVVNLDPASPDPDGDGVPYIADHFPNDPDRAFVSRSPASDLNTIAFEDSYPVIGDYDFNDAVVQFSIDTVTNGANQVKEIVGTYHLLAHGAWRDHRFGVGIDGVPANATGTLQIERIAPDGAVSLEPVQSLAEALRPLPDGRTSLRLDTIFPSTQAALGMTGLVNTSDASPRVHPASTKVRIVFTRPIDPIAMAAPPFDPYLAVIRGGEVYDVHTVGKLPFLGRPGSLPRETGSTSFVDTSFHPWALLMPTSFRFPLERVPIEAATSSMCSYPRFGSWRSSHGSVDIDWYRSPNTTAGKSVADPTPGSVYQRSFTLRTGG
jgi:LruC domain-containing protein